MPALSTPPARRSPLARWAVWAALALSALWALAAPDFDRLLRLARERYGPTAEETVQGWRRLLAEQRNRSVEEQLAAVNTFFNRRVLYELDPVVWGQADHWATPLEFMGRGAGDCEDFAIAKYITLLELGVPDERLRLIYVRARTAGAKTEAHMVLGYYDEPTAEPLILDNLITSIRPAANRPDLTPVFSFNRQGLWVAGQTQSAADPTTRLSRWRDVLDRMKQEGL
ncbi:putative transglutaminase-like cysteine proteinase [Tepidimonas ignava]|uniref:Bacterial transglutaminase-like cysteine proteinase BTLCP n=1 Tax=Tepidimonas ignava TaxID=114249 RepID=A0A4R3LEQ7_9BURK|nr:putative transglutaminase-like cysteine proteinase [Tepidimonas ignava]TSE19564.1 Bacterial transglutaminase-like cysteine proteinase BTLCP [Tepidimonas ignava]